MAGRPPKRRRITAEQAEQSKISNTAVPRRQHDLRLKSRFDAIFNKYGHDFNGIGDVIDITNGEILVDNGHVSRMRHAGDIGVEVIRTKPAAIAVAKRRQAVSHVEDTSERDEPLEEEDHDELTSPMRPRPQDTAQDEGVSHEGEVEDQAMIQPEQHWSTPGDLHGTPQPHQVSPTPDIATRILKDVVPKGQQVNLNDPAQLALYTQNLVQEILRQTTNAPPNPAILPTPPASARTGSIRPFRSIWGGEDPYHSEDDGDEDVDEEEATETQPLTEPTRRGRRTWQPDEKAKLLKLRDVDGLTFANIARILDRPNVYEKYAAMTQGRDPAITNSVDDKRSVEPRRRATIAFFGVDSIDISRSKQGEPGTDRPRRRTRQSMPAISVAVPQPEASRLQSLRSRRAQGGNARISDASADVSATVAAQPSNDKASSPEVVDTPSRKGSPQEPIQPEGQTRRRRGRPRKQEPQLATITMQQPSVTAESTIADIEQIGPGDQRRRRSTRHSIQRPELATDTEKQQTEEVPGASLVDTKQNNTALPRSIGSDSAPPLPSENSPTNVPQQPDMQAPPAPPSARSRLRRVSQRFSQITATVASPAPQPAILLGVNAGIAPESPAPRVDLKASIPPAEVEVSAAQGLLSQVPMPRPQHTILPRSPPAARTSKSIAQMVSAGPSSTPHNPGAGAQTRQVRAKRVSGGAARRVSGVASMTPRRVVSSAAASTPMTGTGTSTTAVRRHVVPQDDLGSEDELDQ
jgi:hypothetical protein